MTHRGRCLPALIAMVLAAPVAVVAAPGDPVIDVWYGFVQDLGVPGVPVEPFNILGRVSDDTSVSTLTYSINGGPQMPASIGPDTFRLQNDGDFNLDIQRSEFNVGANDVDITAEDSEGNTTTVTVIVNYTPQNFWPLPYGIDWDNVSTLTDAVTVIDGLWDFDSNGARTLEWGYDRILAVGDIEWTNYEITVPITVHARKELDLGFPSIAPGIGIVMRWQGHANWQNRQPNIGYLPIGADVWYDFANNNGIYQLSGDNGPLESDATGQKLVLGTTYNWKMRCEDQPDGTTFYAAKIWEAGQPEPGPWFLTGSQGQDDLPNGCVLLIAHEVDATFGDVTVVPVGPGSSLNISNLQVTPAETSAEVTWTTNQLADSSVAFGTTNAYELGTVDDAGLVTGHSVTLTNLSPNTLYHIQATSESAAQESVTSNDLTFTTLGPRTITTSVVGDGSVVLTPNQPTYQDDDVVTIEGVGSNGWVFVDWSGDLTGFDNPEQFVVSGNMNITANFTDVIDTNGPIITELQAVPGIDTAQISWMTDEVATSFIDYGPTTAYEDGTLSELTPVFNRTLDLTGLTPATTYHYRARSIDVFGNETIAPDMVFVTTSGLSSGLVSDDFSSGTLNPGVWTFINPTGLSSLVMNGTQAVITVEAGVLHSMYGGGRLCPRIMQDVNNADFELEVSFESLVTQQFQTQGILAEQDPTNYVYFDIFSDGGQMLIYIESLDNGVATTRVFDPIGTPTPVKARLRREGDFWTFEYSKNDGASWTFGASFSYQLNLTQLGVYAGNDSFSGVDSPEFTALVDYVFDTDSPIVPEDGASLCTGVDCSQFDGDCTVGVCDPGTGLCESANTNEGGACDDGDLCTVSDACASGVCGGVPKDCSSEDSACSLGVCNASTGVCEAQPANEGQACDDGNVCTETDVCTNGACVGTSVPCGTLVVSDLQVVPGQTSAEVSWTTNQPADSSVAYGTSNGYELGTVDDAVLVTNHSITLTNLLPGTLYHIQATSETATLESASSDDFVFTTSTPGSRTITTSVVGEGTITLTPDQPTYADDDVVVIEAVASNGWSFVSWSGDLQLFDNPIGFIVNGDMNITGTFTQFVDSNGPMITGLTAIPGITTAQIIWDTDEAASSFVDYGPTTAYEDGTFPDLSLVFNRTLDLTGLTPGTTYHYRARSIDGSGNETIAPDMTFTTSNSIATGIVSDDFSSGVLNPGVWTFLNPTGESSLSMNGTQAVISVEAGVLHSMYGGGRLSPRIMQDVNDADFELEVSFESLVTQQFQTQGIVAEQDPDNYVYFDIFSDGGQMLIYVESLDNGVAMTRVYDPVGTPSPIKARVRREGDLWTFEYSVDGGEVWIFSTAFTFEINLTQLGVFAGNDSFSGVDSPAFTALVDYVFDTDAPIDPEDGASLCNGVDCSSFDGDCTVGVCNPMSGACEAVSANEGNACDDGDLCTVSSTCASGVCAGAPKDCSAQDGSCTVGVCNATTGDCEANPANEDLSCDDGDLCTTNDFCTNGVCAGEAVDCQAFDSECTVGACSAATGECEAQPANEGGGCNDGDLCTEGDVCTSGTCAGSALDCSSLNDDCVTGVCNPGTGGCEAQPANEGGSCDDGDLCSVADACTNGICTGDPVDCSGLDDTCNVGACDALTGVCEPMPANEGGFCDDGDDCTITDACSNGMCESEPLDCSGLDDACNIGVCVGSTGLCEASPINESGTCDDLDLCTINDACTNGTCAGQPKDCSSLDGPCTIGVCNAFTGDCEAQPTNQGGACDDGDLCTVDGTCNAGVCNTAPKDCTGLDDACNVGTCNPTSGACEVAPANEGGVCDDGDACTTIDACTNGVCVGTVTDCSGLSDQCVTGVCNPISGACETAPANEAGACDDGDLCTTLDACTNGVCVGNFVDCSDLDDACNMGVCVSSNGFCEQVPVNSGGGCDDGDLCSEGDVCVDGACQGTPLDCSSLDDQCQTGVCDEGTGECVVELATDGTTCDDGDLCTDDDECTGGACAGIAADCSGLDDACNIGECDAQSGDCVASPANEGGGCDDGVACTVNDTCAGGVCAGTLEDCDGDGQCDSDDNCVSVANPLQADTDFDGFGDACDGIFDADHDGDVDADDLAAFANCLSGVDLPATLSCQNDCDADADGDVDLFDWALFQTAFTGPTAITCP